ncbi:MAG: hypothetical protein R3B06_17945 [Kofleriaceae bacterium]
MRISMAFGMVALALAASAAPAYAQADDLAQRAAAEAAFRQGREQLAAGQTAEACESFAKSQELDPQSGTQYNLALCYDKLGRSASSWALFSALAETDGNKPRRADAAKRAKALQPKLVRVLVVDRGQTPGLVVTRDGVDVTAAIGVATPVDPGPVVYAASAEGYQPWSSELSVSGPGSTITVEVPPLEKVPEVAPPPPPPPDPVKTKLPPPPPPAPIDRDPGRGRRVLGLGLAGGGVAALGVGVAFGILATSANQDAKAECGGDVTDCRGDLATANDLVDGARTKATVSTIAFAVGGAAVAAGVVLYVTAPRFHERQVAVTPALSGDQLGFLVRGSF